MVERILAWVWRFRTQKVRYRGRTFYVQDTVYVLPHQTRSLKYFRDRYGRGEAR